MDLLNRLRTAIRQEEPARRRRLAFYYVETLRIARYNLHTKEFKIGLLCSYYLIFPEPGDYQ